MGRPVYNPDNIIEIPMSPQYSNNFQDLVDLTDHALFAGKTARTTNGESLK